MLSEDIIDELDRDDEEETEVMTAAEVLQKLEEVLEEFWLSPM